MSKTIRILSSSSRLAQTSANSLLSPARAMFENSWVFNISCTLVCFILMRLYVCNVVFRKATCEELANLMFSVVRCHHPSFLFLLHSFNQLLSQKSQK